MTAAGLLWDAAYGLTALYEATGPWILAAPGIAAGLAVLAARRHLKRQAERRAARVLQQRDQRLADDNQAGIDDEALNTCQAIADATDETNHPNNRPRKEES